MARRFQNHHLWCWPQAYLWVNRPLKIGLGGYDISASSRWSPRPCAMLPEAQEPPPKPQLFVYMRLRLLHCCNKGVKTMAIVAIRRSTTTSPKPTRDRLITEPGRRRDRTPSSQGSPRARGIPSRTRPRSRRAFHPGHRSQCRPLLRLLCLTLRLCPRRPLSVFWQARGGVVGRQSTPPAKNTREHTRGEEAETGTSIARRKLR